MQTFFFSPTLYFLTPCTWKDIYDLWYSTLAIVVLLYWYYAEEIQVKFWEKNMWSWESVFNAHNKCDFDRLIFCDSIIHFYTSTHTLKDAWSDFSEWKYLFKWCIIT